MGRNALVAALRRLDVRLEPDEVQRTATFLRATLDGARSPVVATTRALSGAPREGAARSRYQRSVSRRRRPLPWPRRLLVLVLTVLAAGLIGFLAMVFGLSVIQQMADGLVRPPAASTP